MAHGVVNPYLVTTRSGDCATWTGDEPCPYWFDDETVPSAYVGSYGFLVFCGLGIMLADGVWSIVEITFMLISSALSKDGTKADIDPETKALDELFQGDKSLPWWTSLVGYAVFGSSCVAIDRVSAHLTCLCTSWREERIILSTGYSNFFCSESTFFILIDE